MRRFLWLMVSMFPLLASQTHAESAYEAAARKIETLLSLSVEIQHDNGDLQFVQKTITIGPRHCELIYDSTSSSPSVPMLQEVVTMQIGWIDLEALETIPAFLGDSISKDDNAIFLRPKEGAELFRQTKLIETPSPSLHLLAHMYDSCENQRCEADGYSRLAVISPAWSASQQDKAIQVLKQLAELCSG